MEQFRFSGCVWVDSLRLTEGVRVGKQPRNLALAPPWAECIILLAPLENLSLPAFAGEHQLALLVPKA
eukprot:1480012-Amphidinium_carterae.1